MPSLSPASSSCRRTAVSRPRLARAADSRTTCMCSGAQLSRTAAPPPGSLRPLGLAGVRHQHRHRDVARAGARRSGSRCRGRPSSRPRRRRSGSPSRRGLARVVGSRASRAARRRGSARRSRSRRLAVSTSRPVSSRIVPRPPLAGVTVPGHQVGDPDEAGDERGAGALVHVLGRVHLLDTPFDITAIRSDIVSASSWSWVT